MHDGWLALLCLGFVVLIAGPLTFQADPSDARVAVFAMLPPVVLAALVLLREPPTFGFGARHAGTPRPRKTNPSGQK